ncbi:MAG: hypothetical protein ACYCZ3_11615 [Thiobacillus sp.]
MLKRFHDDGVLFSLGINEDNELVARSYFLEPPQEAVEVCSSMLSLAKLGDGIERDFFGVDLE